MEDIRARGRLPCIVALALGLLAACGQGGTTFEGGDEKLGAPVPSAISASTLTDDSLLRAFLDINGERHQATFNGGAVESTVTNLPVGVNTVAIVFEYQSPIFGNVVLATATQTLNLQPGQNSLAFNEQDYQYPDDDGDGASNLAEIRNNTDPGDPDGLLRWGVAVPISNADRVLARTTVAVDPSGNGLAAWTQIDAEGQGVVWTSVWANRFAPDTGWGIPERIAADGAYPQVAMDANGNGLVVWYQGDNLLATRFDLVSGWAGTPSRVDLESSSAYPSGVRLAMSSSGVAVAVWEQSSSSQREIFANRFDGTAWSGARMIGDNVLNESSWPAVAVDANGNALAIWRHDGNLQAARYIADTGWGTPAEIERLAGASELDFSVAMDGNGNGIAAWVQTADMVSTVTANHFDATTGMWGDATLIQAPSSVGASPARRTNVGFDSAGNAFVVWEQESVEGFNHVWANRFDAVTMAWGSATWIQDTGYQSSGRSFPTLSVRADGEALAVWSDGRIYANRFDPLTQAWGTPALVDDDGNKGSGEIALADNGRGLAVWQRFDASSGNTVVLSAPITPAK